MSRKKKEKIKIQSLDELKVFIKSEFKERPNTKHESYSKLQRICFKNNLNLKFVLDYVFGERKRFKFKTLEEGVKEVKMFLKKGQQQQAQIIVVCVYIA